ncbi:TPA: helicase [Legionella pneumophila]|nr:helicase [Legionella pneumophila]HAT8182119.1 helicase [Legionella pneumophila]
MTITHATAGGITMTVKLIRKGETDTNNYEEYLDSFGYEALEKSLKEDAQSVCQFFCNEELVLQGLKKLVIQFYQFNQPEKKTLRQFFDDWGSKNHFNHQAPCNTQIPYETSPNFHFPNHTPFLYGELTADLFNNVLLKQGYLSADLGAGPKHGKWAHTIQIFILEEARKTGQLKLHSNNVCEFIKKISQIHGKYESFTLWNILFDSFDDTFTYPNLITQTLTSQWDNSKEAQFLADKLNNFQKKFDEAASVEQSYNAYANKKYMSRIDKANYVKYKDKCALLWFAPQDKKTVATSSSQVELSLKELNLL